MELPKPAATVGSDSAVFWDVTLSEGTKLFTAEQVAELMETEEDYVRDMFMGDPGVPSPIEEFRAAYCRKVEG